MSARVMDLLRISNFGRELSSPVPSWSGFMQIVNKEGEFECTKIQILPFINLNPNDMSTIYIALSFAQKLCDRHKIAAAPVTFDQPPYIKAVDVIAACQPELCSLFARLGGFHWLMSALGSLGYVMGGSGLDDVFKTVYAPGTVPHIMSGHAYSRAFRAHLLASSALLFTLLDDQSMIINGIDQSISKLLNGKLSSPEVGKDNDMLSMADTITDIIDKNSSDSRIASVWKLYLCLTHLLRLMIFAERTGNFLLHLHCMELYIPVFHAAGHFAYAKCTRIYIQQMKSLKDKIPEEDYTLFSNCGYFTIRRKDHFFSGNFSDIVIEQDLMRLFKCSGGMTRGRGITDSTISSFVNVMPRCIPICSFLEDFTGLTKLSSEQHKVNLRPSNISRDLKHFKSFLNWFQIHSPFVYKEIPSLVCHLIELLLEMR